MPLKNSDTEPNKTTASIGYWDVKQNIIQSKIGKWIGGQDIHVHQYTLFNDLFEKISYMQMMVLNITGRIISKELAQWLENNFLCMSYPDARIWCNQVGALAGTTQTSPTAATVAGILAADSRIYGGSQTTMLAMEYIQAALVKFEAGQSIDEIIANEPLKHGRPAIIGFARPVNKVDERIIPHQKMTKNLGFTVGKHMQLANDISKCLVEKFGSGINIGGYTAAFLSDQSFTPKQGYQIKSLCVSSGVTACYIDNLKHNNNEFLPQKCSDISYSGPKIRTLD